MIGSEQPEAQRPIRMILFCPVCDTQHIDAPDDRTQGWVNPPHRSHLCHHCGTIWRPADVATEGVAAIETKGRADTWTVENRVGGGGMGRPTANTTATAK